ncbi:MAG: DUF1543 domain-containing protein [Taibaiella sp.]|nr:DUF1543 domain-containing protein [Taibaiella sp.]
MILVGCRPPGRFTEQHDIFFGIGESMKSLLPEIKEYWPEAKGKLHIDAYREVTAVDGYSIEVVEKQNGAGREAQLFFINLGGYQRGLFDELHFKVLTVQPDKARAVKQAKTTEFFKKNGFLPGAGAHIDDQHGIDIDDLHKVNDILPPRQKELYSLRITRNEAVVADVLHLGYFKLTGFK